MRINLSRQYRMQRLDGLAVYRDWARRTPHDGIDSAGTPLGGISLIRISLVRNSLVIATSNIVAAVHSNDRRGWAAMNTPDWTLAIMGCRNWTWMDRSADRPVRRVVPRRVIA
jgi:hypothetical protein